MRELLPALTAHSYTSCMIKSKSGFTIVELLIVIVVIGILAAITIVAYNGIRDRATTARRLSDMDVITKALEMYKTQKGYYPAVQSNSSGGWERSAVNPQNFLQALKTEGILATVPVDPINTAPQGAMGPESTFTSYTYYLYPAGSYESSGCPTSSGAVYVLYIQDAGKSTADSSPGMSCAAIDGKNWGRSTGTVYWKGQSTY